MSINFSEALALIAAGIIVLLLFVVLQQSMERPGVSSPVALHPRCSSVSSTRYKPSNLAAHQTVRVLSPASIMQSVRVKN